MNSIRLKLEKLSKFIENSVVRISDRSVPHIVVKSRWSVCWFEKQKIFKIFEGYATAENNKVASFPTEVEVIEFFNSIKRRSNIVDIKDIKVGDRFEVLRDREGVVGFHMKGSVIEVNQIEDTCLFFKGDESSWTFEGFDRYYKKIEDEPEKKEEFTGFKEGYYYRYWRNDGIKYHDLDPKMEPFFDGQWRKCVSLDSIRTQFEGIEGRWYWGNLRDFHAYYQEMSPEEFKKRYETKFPCSGPISLDSPSTKSEKPWTAPDTGNFNPDMLDSARYSLAAQYEKMKSFARGGHPYCANVEDEDVYVKKTKVILV